MTSKTPSPSRAKIVRCHWTGIEDPVYARYHDEEWGVPLLDDRALFEKMVLEGFQSGLSWLTILKKRDNFRRAFHNFDATRIARYSSKDIARLMDDAGIVRNKMKIEATIDNARAYLALVKHTRFSHFVWSFAGENAAAERDCVFQGYARPDGNLEALSKALKAEGFRFVGPTTVYAFMQSSGMVNDHLVACHRHKACAKLQRALKIPGR